MYWGTEGNEAENANVWQKKIFAWDQMGGGMSGEPLQGVSVHAGNRAASHVTRWMKLEGGHRLAHHWPEQRAEVGPRGQTSRNTYGGRAPFLNWCGLGASRGPFSDEKLRRRSTLFCSVARVSFFQTGFPFWSSIPATLSTGRVEREVEAHPILHSCQRAITYAKVCGLLFF